MDWSSNIKFGLYQGTATLSVAFTKEFSLTDLSCDKFLQLLNANPYPRLPDGLVDDIVFDPFNFENIEYYHHYQVGDGTWRTTPTLPLESRAHWDSYEDKHAESDANDNDILRAISFLPFPSAPPRLGAAPVIGPFIFRDRRFCWIFEADQLAWGLTIELNEEDTLASQKAVKRHAHTPE